MIIDNSKGLTKLLADEGKKITNKDRSFFSDFIYLGKNDFPDNYEEVGREIWKHFIEEENPDVVELKARLEDANRDIIRLREDSINQEECLLDTDFRLVNLELNLGFIE